MVVLNVTYHCKPGKRDQFLDIITAEGIDVTSRGEDGNIKYDYYKALGDENELMLVEKWADDASLDRHKTQPHFARLGALKDAFVEETVIEKYER